MACIFQIYSLFYLLFPGKYNILWMYIPYIQEDPYAHFI